MPPPTETPTPEPVTAYLDGCGGGIVRYWLWEVDVKNALDQWNRLVEPANLVIEAWNHFVVSTGHVVEYDQAAGNAGFVEVADNYLMTARRELPNIQAESGHGQFGSYADVFARLIALEIEYVDSLRAAAAHYDVGAWNYAVDLQYDLDVIDAEYRAKYVEACDYWANR